MFHPVLRLVALVPHAYKLPLKLHNNELVEEGNEITRVPTMPEGQETKSSALTNIPIIHKLESLVDILGGPGVSVDVKRLNDFSKPGCGLQPS